MPPVEWFKPLSGGFYVFKDVVADFLHHVKLGVKFGLNLTPNTLRVYRSWIGVFTRWADEEQIPPSSVLPLGFLCENTAQENTAQENTAQENKLGTIATPKEAEHMADLRRHKGKDGAKKHFEDGKVKQAGIQTPFPSLRRGTGLSAV